MKNKLLTLVLLTLSAMTLTAQGSLEQYCYLKKNKPSVWVPMVHYRTGNGWYAEGRFNYEYENTFSLYAGKEFSRKGKLNTSVTPLIGGVAGAFKGVSTGLNISVMLKRFFFSSQSQYTMSSTSGNSDFFFSWSELAYQPARWIYAGVSAQHTYYSAVDLTSFEPGIVTGIKVRKWVFPFYCFNITNDDRYFVLGINLDLDTNNVTKH